MVSYEVGRKGKSFQAKTGGFGETGRFQIAESGE